MHNSKTKPTKLKLNKTDELIMNYM